MGRRETVPMIRDFVIDNLEVHVGGQKLFDHLSFTVVPGEMLGIIGPNGAGKSTLLKAILGLITPQSGTITVHGDHGKAVFGYVPQVRAIDEEMPIQTKDFVSLGLPLKLRPWLTRSEREKLRKVMALTRISHLAKKPIGKLSGGERQRAFLAQALVREPDVLLLDESTANLDPGAQEQMMALVHDLNKKKNTTVLFVSHDLTLVSKYAHRVLYLSRQRSAIGQTADMLNGNVLANFYAQDASSLKQDRSSTSAV